MRDVKVGDVVHVRATVTAINQGEGDAYFSARDGEGDIRGYMCRADIVHVETRPLQVGDVVTWGTGDVAYELRAFVDDQATLRKRVLYTSDVFEYITRSVTSLRIAERV